MTYKTKYVWLAEYNSMTYEGDFTVLGVYHKKSKAVGHMKKHKVKHQTYVDDEPAFWEAWRVRRLKIRQ